jgi:hypothetical protein
MKETDEHLFTPPFPKQTESGRSRRLPVFLYAAATIAAVVVAAVFFIYKNGGQEQKEEIVILIGPDNMNTNSLIEEKSLSEWESPTDFLAEDF